MQRITPAPAGPPPRISAPAGSAGAHEMAQEVPEGPTFKPKPTLSCPRFKAVYKRLIGSVALLFESFWHHRGSSLGLEAPYEKIKMI